MKSLKDYETEAAGLLAQMNPQLVNPTEIKKAVSHMLRADRDAIERAKNWHLEVLANSLTPPYQGLHANRVVAYEMDIMSLGRLIEDHEGKAP